MWRQSKERRSERESRSRAKKCRGRRYMEEALAFPGAGDDDDDGWRCQKHPSPQRTAGGVCPGCLRLCPHCGGGRPCGCRCPFTSSTASAFSYSLSSADMHRRSTIGSRSSAFSPVAANREALVGHAPRPQDRGEGKPADGAGDDLATHPGLGDGEGVSRKASTLTLFSSESGGDLIIFGTGRLVPVMAEKDKKPQGRKEMKP